MLCVAKFEYGKNTSSFFSTTITMTKRKSLQLQGRKSKSPKKSKSSFDDSAQFYSAKEKKDFITPYVNQLVQQKLDSKNHRLDRDSYTKVYETLKRFNIQWLTVSNLKMRVMREFKKQKKLRTRCLPSSTCCHA